MARRRVPTKTPDPAPPTKTPARAFTRPRVSAAVALLLAVHFGLAVDSLRRENATVDEIAHLPAGLSYWQKGTFKLYHHNPPLAKLVAALPLVLAGPVTAPLYEMGFWAQESQATFGEVFAYVNAREYLELFDSARMLMPLFSVLGGLAVFAWSSRLYGPAGGLISLTLWCLCPNVLAHGRLVTSDVAAASIGVGATYLFWRYLRGPSWSRAALAGLALGLAEATKFNLLLLYAAWPGLALVRWTLQRHWPGVRAIGQGAAIVALSVLVIDLAYGFEGVGRPLGTYEFASHSLTSPVPPGSNRPTHPNPLIEATWRHRVNRFRGTWLGSVPVPLPRHYLIGFDEQKLETEGVPLYYLDDNAPRDDSVRTGYPVYLDGVMRRSGWWYYYLATLAYKLPEGTWFLALLATAATIGSRRARSDPADELAVLAIPVGVLLAMSFLTDICLGLRYILPIFPYAFVAVGRLGPWAAGLGKRPRRVATAAILLALGADAAALAAVHPHYLAYFNQASGGPDRGSGHLIDSNLDWGQDLTTLARWLKANHPGRAVGLAYFGQINPSLLNLRGEGIEWFLPPARPKTAFPMIDRSKLVGPAAKLTPGLYAISATVVRGLPWRFHDSVSIKLPHVAWPASWKTDEGAFSYFAELTPIHQVGHSIYVYELTRADCDRLARHWAKPSRVD